MHGRFQLETRHLDGGAAVALIGELDIAGIDQLHEFHRLADRYDLGQLTLWCGRLEFIDAAGLGALLAMLRRFGQDGRPRLMDVPRQMLFLLESTETADLFQLDHETGDATDPVLRSCR